MASMVSMALGPFGSVDEICAFFTAPVGPDGPNRPDSHIFTAPVGPDGPNGPNQFSLISTFRARQYETK